MGAQRWVNHPTLGRMTLERYNEISPLIRPLRVSVDAADYDRDVAEAETRGVERAVSAATWWMSPAQIADLRDLLAGGTGHAARTQRELEAALRKPEVEG